MSRSKQKATRVLVSRPAHQSAGFIKLLQNAGFTEVELPCIEIEFTKVDLTETLRSDLIIFTSANAVTGANKNVPLPWNDSKAKIAAIGQATAMALEQLDCKVDVVPNATSSSEALLDIIGNVTNHSVTIVRGDSGREKLYNALIKRNAKPRYQPTYKRKLPQHSQAKIKTLFIDGIPDIISITSDLGLNNLVNIIPPELTSSLLSKPLVVNSQRCAQLAIDHGFTAEIKVANPPGDESQLKNLLKLRELLS